MTGEEENWTWSDSDIKISSEMCPDCPGAGRGNRVV